MVMIFEQGDIVYLDFDPSPAMSRRAAVLPCRSQQPVQPGQQLLTMQVCPITHTDWATRSTSAG